MNALIYAGAFLASCVAMICVVEMALAGYRAPTGTLFPDGEEDEQPLSGYELRRRVVQQDQDVQRRAELYVAVTTSRQVGCPRVH